MLVGGGILVMLVAPIQIDCCNEHGPLASSILKAIITLGLVILWIIVLVWMKRIILHRTVT